MLWNNPDKVITKKDICIILGIDDTSKTGIDYEIEKVTKSIRSKTRLKSKLVKKRGSLMFIE